MSLQARERRNWSPEEDALLEAAVSRARATFPSLPWHTIAANLPGRTNKDCRKRWHYKLDATVNKGSWTIAEDEKLRGAVATHGTKWAKVASVVGTRNGDQCSKRWQNTLDPGIDRTPWSPQEVDLLLQSVERLGHKWTAIVEENFPGRTALSAKNQYALLRRNLCLNNDASTPGSEPSSTSSPLKHSPGCAWPGTSFEGQSTPSEELDSDWEGVSAQDALNDRWDESPDFGHLGYDWMASADNIPSYPYGYATTQSHTQSTGYMSNMSSGHMQNNAYSDFQYPYQDTSMYPMAKTSQPKAKTCEIETPTFPLLPITSSDSIPLAPVFAPHTPTTIDPVLTTTITSPAESPFLMKQLTVTTSCTSAELQQLMRMTVATLTSVSLTVDSQQLLPTAAGRRGSGGEKRKVSITASCSAMELGKFMNLVTDTMSEVSFSVIPA